MDLSMCSDGGSDDSDDQEDEEDEEDEQTRDSDYESSDHSEEEDSCGPAVRDVDGRAYRSDPSTTTTTTSSPDEINSSIILATAALAACSLHETSITSNSNKKDNINKLQKVNKLSQFVPYSAQLETTRKQLWTNIKAHHCSAAIGQGDHLDEWIYACNQYLTAFGLAFTKADHIMLIKLCWQSLIHTEQDFLILKKLASLLGRLLKLPSLLNRSDLQLDWRQLYDLVERINHNKHVRKQTIYFDAALFTVLTNLVSASSFYFSATSTAEMLAEWKDYLCIYSNKFSRYLYLFMLFFPLHLPPEEHHLGFRLWFEDFMRLWAAMPTQDTSHHYNYFLFLFSNLAKNAFGYIDWTPYMPMILQRIKKRFNCKTSTDLELSMAASWFVYNITPQNNFFATLKAYFKFRFVNHKRIICYLLGKFILRLKIERRKTAYWYDHTPAEHRLTPPIIADFAAWMCEQFERISFADFEIEHLYNLSLLCSPEMSQQVWKRLSVAAERPFEPDRLKYALQLFSVSLYPMVSDEKLGDGHRAHVIPVLCGLLKSVNTNDHTLAFLHLFAIRSIIIMGIPLEDCSTWKVKEGGNQQENTLLKDSAQLETFPSDFVDLCEAILESNNDDLFRMNQKGIMVRNIIFEILVHIFAVISEERKDALCSRLVTYSTSRIVENVECVKIIDKMMLAALLSDKSGRIFEAFFSRISANIFSSVEGERPKFSDICKSEFVYNWRLLQTCFSFDGAVLLRHKADIIALLKRIYQIDFEDNFKHNNLITDVLSFLFYILTSIYLPCYAFDHRVDEKEDEKEDKGRREQIVDRLLKFPYTCKLRQLPLKWHQPSPEEIDFAKDLFREFIRPEMASLEAWTNSTLELASSQVEKSFGIILSFLGCVHCIPNFKKDAEDEVSSQTSEEKYFNSPDIFAIDLFDGENFRETLISLMVAVAGKLNRDHSSSDNVTIFKLIIEVIDYTLFNYKTISAAKSVSHSIYKTLVREKSTLPIVQYYYIISYQLSLSCILKRWSNLFFCSTHQKAMELLLELSTCTSSKIRSQAQVILIDIWSTFPRSYVPVLPQLLANLQKGSCETVSPANYDSFKGTLYLLYGSAKQSIALNRDWETLLAVWPALVAVNSAEKPKIARLFDVWFMPLFTDHYQTIPIERDLLASRFMKGDKQLFEKAEEGGWVVPTEVEIVRIEKQIVCDNERNRDCYQKLIEKLLLTLETGKLHWRFYIMGCTLLDLLIRHDQPFPLTVTQFFVDNLTNELISIRWISIVAVKKILFLHKPAKVISFIPEGNSSEDLEVFKDCLECKSRFEATVFHDKIHDGYLDGRPKEIVKFVPQDVSKLQFIADTFQDPVFLDKFFALQSIEQDSKTVCGHTVKLWKHLTQVFGLFFNASLVFLRIEALLAKRKYNYDKFALEVLAGIVKATPILPYEDLLMLKTFMTEPIFERLVTSFNKESYNYWYNLFSVCFLNRDLRRYGWVFDLFFNTSSPLFTDRWGPYPQASFMYFIATAQPSNWRFSSLSQAVIDRLFDQLEHKYSYVRYAVSYMLCNSFHYRIGIGFTENYTESLQPQLVDFIIRVQEKLKDALSSLAVTRQQHQIAQMVPGQMATVKSDLFNADSRSGQALVHLLDTICHWLSDCLKSKLLVGGHVFARFLKSLALIQTTGSSGAKESVQRQARNAISYIAVQVYRPEDVPSLIADIREVAANWNWHTRAVASTFSHTLVFNNRFILNQRPEWVQAMLDIILSLLADEVIEVRESARQTLRDYIKWDFFTDTTQRDELIRSCKEKAALVDYSSTAAFDSPEVLIRRHSGILGLVAFVYACHPSEMPDLLPDILLFLARRVGDAQPIQKTVTAALRFFKKTHEPYWIEHKRKFSEEQLAELANVLISSSCFA